MVDVALLYIFLIRRRKRSLEQCFRSVASKESWEILSKASVKSSDDRHSGVPNTSAYDTASRVVAIASKTMVPGRPHCWAGCSISINHGRRRFAIILVGSL